MKLQKIIKVWCKLPVELDPDQTAEVEIRSFTHRDILKLRDVATESKQLLRSDVAIESADDVDGVEFTTTISERKWAENTACMRITQWRGFFDEDGHELNCTTRNKILFTGEKDFYNWLVTIAALIDKEATGTLEKEEKNSLNSVKARPAATESPATAKHARKAGPTSADG